MSKENLHKLADKKAGRDRNNAMKELALRYMETHGGRVPTVSALDRTEPRVH